MDAKTLNFLQALNKAAAQAGSVGGFTPSTEAFDTYAAGERGRMADVKKDEILSQEQERQSKLDKFKELMSQRELARKGEADERDKQKLALDQKKFEIEKKNKESMIADRSRPNSGGRAQLKTITDYYGNRKNYNYNPSTGEMTPVSIGMNNGSYGQQNVASMQKADIKPKQGGGILPEPSELYEYDASKMSGLYNELHSKYPPKVADQYFKLAENSRKEIGTKIEKITDKFAQGGVTEMMAILDRVSQLLPQGLDGPDEQDVPGIGIIENKVPGQISEFFGNKGAVTMDKVVENLTDLVARARTGAVINDDEAKRFNNILGRGSFDTEEGFVKGIREFRNLYNKIIGDRLAGYPQHIQKTYLYGGGTKPSFDNRSKDNQAAQPQNSKDSMSGFNLDDAVDIDEILGGN